MALSEENVNELHIGLPKEAWTGMARLYKRDEIFRPYPHNLPKHLATAMWGKFLVIGDREVVEQIVALK